MTNRKMCDHSKTGWRPEDGLPDLSMLSDITDDGININLKARYERNQIYTYSGSILIAVNPYKQLDIYNSQWIAKYRDQPLDQTDPHVFALAEAMYMNLRARDFTDDRHKTDGTGNSANSPSGQLNPTNLSQQNHLTATNSNSKAQSTRLAKTIYPSTNQACVISGESGAGKTETTKFILSYLCSVTPNKSTWMEHQILEANTILEAFGNAKTVRNDNSSRFGKFIQICFDSHYQINGCIIQDYLLEQSRITYQSFDERNYHVFYQLLSAGQTNQLLRKQFHLMPANFYDYLNKTNCYSIEGIDDCNMFDSLRTAMSVLNMDSDSCDGIFSVLSAILWLGNLHFKCDEEDPLNRSDNCQLTENDCAIIKIVAELLGVEKEKLEPITLKRQINVRGNVTEIPFKIQEARDNRNGMAKALYSRLFTWVVNFINASTNPSDDNICFLGVLDIFGFENFDTNSFEQLCINYANEKLHKFFNHHMFAMEQELYRREGIEFCDINFTDNTPCLELLERPPNCVLRLLSEECRVPKGNDSTFIEKLHTEFSVSNPHPFYIKGNDKRKWSSEFSIRHFAGSVTYQVGGILEKNRDSQQNQLLDIIESSSNSLMRDLVNCHGSFRRIETKSSRSSSLRQESIESSSSSSIVKPRLQNLHSFGSFGSFEATSQNSSMNNLTRRDSLISETASNRMPNSTVMNSSTKNRPTVADTFRVQLTSLVELLNSVNPWYVRCIKPNLEKSATGYDDRQVLLQLKYLGMSDLIKIRREGYPIHLTKHQFVCRYRCLMLKHLRHNPSVSPINLDEHSLGTYCLRILHHFKHDPNDWKIGKTMVLLRTNVYRPMEEMRNAIFNQMATKLQASWRCYVRRKEYKRARSAAIRIQEVFRAYRGRLLYLRKKRAVLTIQAFVRGMFAREIANALRAIKRAEQEKARKLALLHERARKQDEIKLQNQDAQCNLQNSEVQKNTEKEDMKIVASATVSEDLVESGQLGTEKDDRTRNGAAETGSPAPQANISPAGSSSASWAAQECSPGNTKAQFIRTRDNREMEDLVRVLERHGITLDPNEQNSADMLCDDFEKLYDILGNQIPTNGEIQSISPSVNDDDRLSYATMATTCDGDSISCSGHSQISSTVTDEQTFNDGRKTNSNEQDHSTESSKHDTVNQNQDIGMHCVDENKYHSNSTESIASIVSSTSTQSNHQQCTASQPSQPSTIGASLIVDTQPQPESGSSRKSVESNGQNRVSSFTGGSLLISGSKLVSNGQPLTRIEEEPNSTTSSPSKTPTKTRSGLKTQSLFPPSDEEEFQRSQSDSNFKKRRLERKILQVQQDQIDAKQPINPTTAGVPVCRPIAVQKNEASFDCSDGTKIDSNVNQDEDVIEDNIYGIQKCNVIEYAEKVFNNHPRDSSGSSGVIRTLSRRRKSVDTVSREYLTKCEMLSYNSSFTIPTSHVKMHDPHNSQLSCSLFKNLCKYMTNENLKLDAEARIIQSIIRHGIEKSELRDEIYVQIIRQLTNNPNNEHCKRLWVFLGLVSAAFSPSKVFSKHLVAYLRSKPKKDPSITCHAQFCLDNLQASRIGSRRYPPSALEIQACKNLTNLSCKIYLLDGRRETISIHPCDTALDTMTKLAHRIDLQSTEGWSLYESYTPGTSKYPHPVYEQKGDFERSVKAHSFMADLIASWQEDVSKKTLNNVNLKTAQKRIDEGSFRLTLKKKIFRGPKIRNDPVEISLLYAQAVYNVVKKDSFLVDENLALTLAGLQAQITLGNPGESKQPDHGKKSRPSKVQAKDNELNYEVETYICHRIRQQAPRPKKEWVILISRAHKQFHGVNEVFCKMRYLSMVIYHCPLYGTATFRVNCKGYQTLDQNLMFGVNAEGLVLINSSNKTLVNAYRYSDICNRAGITCYVDEHLLQMNVRDRADGSMKCLTFEASESDEISQLIACYAPQLKVTMRGASSGNNITLDPSFDMNTTKKKPKLKMTLEDRMRTHQEVQNARRAIIRGGKLRKLTTDENPNGLRSTLKRLTSNKSKPQNKSSRLENIYTNASEMNRLHQGLPQTSSDYNIYGLTHNQNTSSIEQAEVEVAGATAAPVVDEFSKNYPHRFWAYTNIVLKNSLLTIYDPDLEEAALTNFHSILTYSGLINYQGQNDSGNCTQTSTLDSSSIDSGIASQQSLSNLNNRFSSDCHSPSNSSSDIYDVGPKKIDEKDRLKLAQSILDRCLRRDADILKNEFFLQLIKQTTDHPDPNSEINQRHWQLLALACSVTFPSDGKILSYLYAHLRRCSLDQVTYEGRYAQFTLKSLQGTLDTKGRRLAPSEMEIICTINCRRVYTKVYFPDGQFQAVEFDPCATIAEVLDQIKLKTGLRPDSCGYALFQPLDEDCEQVLLADEKVGDAIASWELWHRRKQVKNELPTQQQSSSLVTASKFPNKNSLASLNSAPKNKVHRFVFKRYLYVGNNIEYNDPVERELLFHQINYSIKEDKFPILEQEATILCALRAQIDIGDYAKLQSLPSEQLRTLYKQVIMSFMPPHAFNSLPIPAIAQQHQAFRGLNPLDAKKYFFNLIHSFGRVNFPNNSGHILLHTSHIYDATQTFASAWPSNLWIVINQSGLHMLVARSRQLLASCEYRKIVDYNSSNDFLMVIVLTNTQSSQKYMFRTKQAQQIAQQMKDYVNTQASNGIKRRKSVEFNLGQQMVQRKFEQVPPHVLKYQTRDGLRGTA